MKVKQNRKGYKDVFLKRNVSVKGLSFKMTENTYIKNEAWLAMMPKVIKVIQTIPYIEWNPQWLVLQIFDSFGSLVISTSVLGCLTPISRIIVGIFGSGEVAGVSVMMDG